MQNLCQCNDIDQHVISDLPTGVANGRFIHRRIWIGLFRANATRSQFFNWFNFISDDICNDDGRGRLPRHNPGKW